MVAIVTEMLKIVKFFTHIILSSHKAKLHGPPMLVDKTNFGLVFYNHANFYRFEKTSCYWAVKRISVFPCFSLVNQRHTAGITVYNGTVTNIENTMRAVHKCNGWLVEALQKFSA